MARKQPDPSHELDPLKGGLKHNPFAALRGKVEASASAPAPASGQAPAQPLERTPGRAPEKTPERTPGPKPAATSKPAPAAPPSRITVRIERTGRGGKTVTLAEGPGLAGRKLEPLAREIARGMGTGARVEGSAIAVQGDQRERLVEWLLARGFGGALAGN